MKRNWYAAFLLIILGGTLLVAGWYIRSSTKILTQKLQTAYSYAQQGFYEESEQAFEAAAAYSRENSFLWLLLIRRSLVDQLNQTLATLPSYVSPNNLADLSVETARASTQTYQIQQSFFSWF